MSQDEKKTHIIICRYDYNTRVIVVNVYKIYLQVYTVNGVIVILLKYSVLQ